MNNIDRKTAIALAEEAGAYYAAGTNPGTVYALSAAGLERLCNLVAAHSRKDAEPVAYRWVWKSKYPDIEGWCYQSTPPAYPERQEIENLYAHPPEADKLLQQALEAVLDEHLPGFTEDAPRQHDDVIYDKAIEDAADAIQQLIARTYLEGKK